MKATLSLYESRQKAKSGLVASLLAPISKQKALTIAIVITLVTMVIEFVASLITGSLMLFSDGLHMLSHASSLGVTYLAMILSRKSVGKQFPFGWQRVEILAALFNGLSLLFFSGYVVYEAAERLYNPVAVDSFETILIAVVGLIVNLITAFVLSRAKLEDLNTKSAFVHLLADTFSSVTIIIGGIVIYYTDWFVIDTLLSLVVASVILKWAWGLIRDASQILLERTPKHLRIEDIEEDLIEKFEVIGEVTEIRIWEITTGVTSGCLRLYCPMINPANQNTLRQRIISYLNHMHQLDDVIIEIYY